MANARVLCVSAMVVAVLAWGWLPLVEIPGVSSAADAGQSYGLVIDAGSSGSRVRAASGA